MMFKVGATLAAFGLMAAFISFFFVSGKQRDWAARTATASLISAILGLFVIVMDLIWR